MKDKFFRAHMGRYLKSKREEAALNQKEVGEALGYTSGQFISNFERGLRSVPQDKLKQLMVLYKIPGEELTRVISYLQQEALKRSLAITDQNSNHHISHYENSQAKGAF